MYYCYKSLSLATLPLLISSLKKSHFNYLLPCKLLAGLFLFSDPLSIYSLGCSLFSFIFPQINPPLHFMGVFSHKCTQKSMCTILCGLEVRILVIRGDADLWIKQRQKSEVKYLLVNAKIIYFYVDRKMFLLLVCIFVSLSLGVSTGNLREDASSLPLCIYLFISKLRYKPYLPL